VYLEKLKIFGFKSFAKKAVFDFMPGITGVVGPNGCGKSNIVDAIRWVLGEQRAGTLRSDRMENVIFNGSKTQKPLGMAEVSIVIQNTNNVLPVEYSEVMITRRLFRSGESQYLINNNPCRLKDINDLLMDTGLAPDAYSVIELSMVESILNGKPEDRRRIFEEAVGITKYKQRRKLTLRKLDATEQDLLRLDDIITEVRSKVNSLHRQVRRAQRYQELSKNLKETELRVATHHFSKIYEELGPLNEQYGELTQKRESLTSQISFKEAEVETFQADLLKMEEQLQGAHSRLNEVNSQIQKREEEVLLSRERLKSLADNKTRIEAEIENLKERIASQKQQRVEIEGKIKDLTEQIEALRSDYQQQQQSLDQLVESINQKKIQSRQVEQQVFVQMQSISEKQRASERLQAQLSHLMSRQQDLAQEKQALVEKMSQDRQLKKQLVENIEQQQSELDELTAKQSRLELESEQLQTDIDRLKDAVLKKNGEIDAINQRIAFLRDLLENYADYPQGVKYLLTKLSANQGIKTTVAEAISVDDNYRKAVEAALGEKAACLLVQDETAAYLGIKTLRDNQQGVVTLLPLAKVAASQEKPALPSQPGIIGWLDELVHCSQPYVPAIKLLLGPYLLVEDLTAAQHLASDPTLPGIHLVTLAGEIIFHWGAIQGGRKLTESESLIGRQDQLRKLERQADELQQQLSRLEQQLKTAGYQKKENARQREQVAQQVKQTQDHLSRQQLELSRDDYRIDQANERLARIEQEQTQLSQQSDELKQQAQQIEQELETLTTAHATVNQEFKGHQAAIDEIDKTRSQLADEVNQLNLQIVELSGNERNLRREFEQAGMLIEEYEATIRSRQQELLRIDEQRQQIEARIDELGELIAGDYTRREAAETEVAELDEKNRLFRSNIEEKVKAVTELRREREAVSEKSHELELRKSELRINADNLYRRIVEEYDVELKRQPVDADYDVTVDEEQIEVLRQKIKNLGPVNLLALKEYEQEKGRLDFLEKQQADLITAEQNLKDTISHINKTAQQKFDTTFQQIRQNFINVFKQFFPEGDADLVISEDADPLEATIEIKANPKGKKMESLTLLSGGEKALTAISLLFGIYLVKPSPICILDEVDAPLDDMNIKRFIKALKQFSGSTQFIIVTHNKLTMKSSDCLYGITMEESGVSKIVSVKLD